jgi:hypothetical protein
MSGLGLKAEVNLLPGCDFSLEQGERIFLPGFALKIVGKWIPPVASASAPFSPATAINRNYPAIKTILCASTFGYATLLSVSFLGIFSFHSPLDGYGSAYYLYRLA